MQRRPTRMVARVDISTLSNQLPEDIGFIVGGGVVQGGPAGPVPFINQSKPSNRKPVSKPETRHMHRGTVPT